ncbi:hypothetical protein ACFE04_009906 [Oxalis oulophora]
MAAKLLHSLADENPDLQKQIGCMTGIFQLFDRHHVLHTRRGLPHKRLPAGIIIRLTHIDLFVLYRSVIDLFYYMLRLSGLSEYAFYQVVARTELILLQSLVELNLNYWLKVSTFTNVEFVKMDPFCDSMISSVNVDIVLLMAYSCQSFTLTVDYICRYLGTSHSKNQDFDRESSNLYYPHTSSISERQRTSTESSRPSFSSSCSSSMSSMEFNKNTQPEPSSFDRITFPETPSMNQTITSPRLSGQSLDLRDVVKDSMYRETRGLSVKTSSREESMGPSIKSRDSSPRPLQFSKSVNESYGFGSDGRQDLPDDLKESIRGFAKLQEAPWYYNDPPRFSYDGRELNRLSFESRDTIKSTTKLKELPRLSLDSRVRYLSNNGNSNDTQPNSATRPTSVVAKLMGLETLPDSNLVQSNIIKIPKSPKSSPKGPVSPRWRNPDLIMKPVSSSKFPMEPAPWRQPNGSQKSAVKVPAKALHSFPSVYNEIEKKLKDLQFKQTGKDLRALKQILEAMEAKGLLGTRKDEKASNFVSQKEYDLKSTSPSYSHRLPSQRNYGSASTSRGYDPSRNFESPIVIMKPANNRIPNGGLLDSRKGLTVNRIEQSPRNIRSDSSNDKKTVGRNLKPTNSSSKQQDGPSTSSIKSSGSVSPRLQSKKLELEKNRSRPPTPPVDSNNPRRQQSNKQLTESSSPGRKLRTKSHSPVQSDDESKSSSLQGHDSSLQLGRIISRGPKTEQSAEVIGIQSPSSGSMQKLLAPSLDKNGLASELCIVTPEHPSPVSVLDASLRMDDEPSPVKQAPDAIKGDGAPDYIDNHPNDQWSPPDDLLSDSFGSSDSSRKKLQNIEHLVQKLRQLNSSHDEARTDYIASLCENSNLDHRYISEILLASGLLLRDLGSTMTTLQLHASGHPINPELFFVLEQTKASRFVYDKSVSSKPDHEKCHRKLIFDAVNEILIGKLDLVGFSQEPWLKKSNKLAKKTLNAQKLLKELCSEIEQLQTTEPEFCFDEEEQDSLKKILHDDVMFQSENWCDFEGEVSGIVLDVERSLFKDLIDEIVRGEVAKQTRPRRQLFTTKQ